MPMTREERDALLVRYRDGAAEFRAAMADVTDAELDARPIEGEWTVREIAHHLADSELNSAIRLRRLIAEDEPRPAGLRRDGRSSAGCTSRSGPSRARSRPPRPPARRR